MVSASSFIGLITISRPSTASTIPYREPGLRETNAMGTTSTAVRTDARTAKPRVMIRLAIPYSSRMNRNDHDAMTPSSAVFRNIRTNALIKRRGMKCLSLICQNPNGSAQALRGPRRARNPESLSSDLLCLVFF